MEKKLTLKYPVKQGSEEITELNFKRPKGKDLRKLPTTPGTGDVLDLAARLAGVPPSVIDELDGEDIMEVIGLVGDFLPNSPKTGKTV